VAADHFERHPVGRRPELAHEQQAAVDGHGDDRHVIQGADRIMRLVVAGARFRHHLESGGLEDNSVMHRRHLPGAVP
jgi:hypothetical protein